MNKKVKYLALMILTIVVSVATSYATTLSLLQPNIQSPQQENPQQQSSSKVSLAYNVLILSDSSVVEVFSNINLHNLTIVYQYKYPNGTMATDNVDYGDYYAWGDGIIRVGAVHFATCAPPDYIQALATTYVDPESHLTKISNLNFEVLEVYGYS